MNTEPSKEILDIASMLQMIIWTESKKMTSTESKYHDKYDNLVYDLNRLIDESAYLLDDYKSQGLTFNAIEAEGYHRAMLTVKELINDITSEDVDKTLR